MGNFTCERGKMKRKIVVGVCIVLTSLLVGCTSEITTNSDAERFVGKWSGVEYIGERVTRTDVSILFFSDGDCLLEKSPTFGAIVIIDGAEAYYEVKDNRLVITYKGAPAAFAFDYEFRSYSGKVDNYLRLTANENLIIMYEQEQKSE